MPRSSQHAMIVLTTQESLTSTSKQAKLLLCGRCNSHDGARSEGQEGTKEGAYKGPEEAGDGHGDGQLGQRDGRLAADGLAAAPHGLVHKRLGGRGGCRPAVAVAVQVPLRARHGALLCAGEAELLSQH